MEPCLFRHGKLRKSEALAESTGQLQWSHVFSDMVRNQIIDNAIDGTMLQWSHVFSDMVREATGPPLLGRPGFNGAMSFQTW